MSWIKGAAGLGRLFCEKRERIDLGTAVQQRGGVSENQPNSLQSTVRWLAAHASFPQSRLPVQAERLLLLAAAAQADEMAGEDNRPSFMIQSKNGAMESALRQHSERRRRTHFKCDNSAKV